MKLALAMIVKGTDQEAEVLGRCLSFAARHVDKIFITITHKPGEKRNAAVEDIAHLYNAEISDFEWVNDFAQARNFNFSQVPPEYDYIVWCDADDAFRGLEKLRATMEQHPADAYSMFYLYAFDAQKNPIVVHHKTRVVKNDGCVTWAGKIHEDFTDNRQLVVWHIDGIDVLHLSFDTRFDAAKERNYEIAKLAKDESPDDPRSYYNFGTAAFAVGKYSETIEAYDKFLTTSKSDDEKYIIRLRRAETFWLMDKPNEAIEEAQYAVGIKPNFPDAYFTLGSFYANMNKLQKAAEMFMSGLVKKPPYYKIIVYNPRDYDYVPMMKLADIYFRMSRPDLALPLLEGCVRIYPKDENLKKQVKIIKKETKKFEEVVRLIKKLSKIEDDKKLEAELEKVPDEFKAHPGICNLRNMRLVKKESSGKDLAIYCGYTSEEWNPDTIKAKGIGGSEEAVFHLANRWAAMGWNVTVFNNCGFQVKKFGEVTYKPFWMWNYLDKQDVAIIWRAPMYLDYDINATKVYLDMHDVVSDKEFTKSRVEKVTKVFVKSQFQRSIFPSVPDDKMVVIPNGIVPEIFDENLERDPKLVINTSAPNRGIAVLTEMWKQVRERVPDAKLKWMYGWGTFDAGFEGDTKVMEWKAALREKMKEYGVEELGRLTHEEVARYNLQANIWAYPCGFGEIDCISLTKAMAAGAWPVTTDFAALKEKTGHGGDFIHSDLTAENWSKPYQFDFSIEDPEQIQASIDAIVDRLQNPPTEEERNAMRAWAKENYSWDSIASKWNEIFNAN